MGCANSSPMPMNTVVTTVPSVTRTYAPTIVVPQPQPIMQVVPVPPPAVIVPPPKKIVSTGVWLLLTSMAQLGLW